MRRLWDLHAVRVNGWVQVLVQAQVGPTISGAGAGCAPDRHLRKQASKLRAPKLWGHGSTGPAQQAGNGDRPPQQPGVAGLTVSGGSLALLAEAVSGGITTRSCLLRVEAQSRPRLSLAALKDGSHETTEGYRALWWRCKELLPTGRCKADAFSNCCSLIPLSELCAKGVVQLRGRAISMAGKEGCSECLSVLIGVLADIPIRPTKQSLDPPINDKVFQTVVTRAQAQDWGVVYLGSIQMARSRWSC